MEREEVRSFLSRHGFADVNTLRRRRSGYLHFSCLFGEEEEFYPIHVAVKTGNVKMIRLLLQVGAKKEQETSKGRTAWEIAQDCIRCKHNAAQMEGILQILEGKMKKLGLSHVQFLERAVTARQVFGTAVFRFRGSGFHIV